MESIINILDSTNEALGLLIAKTKFNRGFPLSAFSPQFSMQQLLQLSGSVPTFGALKSTPRLIKSNTMPLCSSLVWSS